MLDVRQGFSETGILERETRGRETWRQETGRQGNGKQRQRQRDKETWIQRDRESRAEKLKLCRETEN